MLRKSFYGRGHSALWFWVCLAGFLFTLTGCADEPVQRDYPKIRTLEVTNITGNGATFVAEVIHEGTVAIAEHGFTWSLSKPDMTTDERIFLGSFTGTGRFEAEISTALGEGTTYEVCAFVKAGDYTVYGEKVKFMSLGSGAPEITDFMPKSTGYGDTVTISGRKFSYLNFTNKIHIDECICAPFYASDTLLKFVLPPEVIKPENSLAVSILGNVAAAAGKLTLIPPEAYGFSPRSGFWGDTISVTGRYLIGLGRSPSDGLWLNGNLKCMAILKSMDSASFVIPSELDTLTSSVSLSYNTFNFSFPGTLTLLPPGTDSIRPREGTWGSRVVLYGKFSNITAQNKVLFGDKQALILSSSYDSLIVKVPDNLTDTLSIISYSSGPFSSNFSQKFTLKGPEISGFEPEQGYAGNLLIIKGQYFKQDALTVTVGGTFSHIKSANDSIIICYVPGDVYGDCTVAVSHSGRTVLAEELFIATNHVITGVTPLLGFSGDTVTVTGTYFRQGITIYLGAYPIPHISLSKDEIKFIIPELANLGSYIVKARYENWANDFLAESQFTFPEYLVVGDFSITDVYPLAGVAGDLITITGTNFSSPHVVLGMTEAEVVEWTADMIIIKVPPLSSGFHNIFVTIGARTHEYYTNYTHSGPWRRLTDPPFPYENGCVFDFGEDVYFATGGIESSPLLRTIYRYNPTNLWFNKLAGTWQSEILNPISCTLGGKGYMIGYKAYGQPIGFEVFVPDSLKWRTLPDYPGTRLANLCLVADDSVVYAGCGKNRDFNAYEWYNDFWKCSPATNKWTRLADSPMNISFTNHIFIDGRLLFLGFQDISGARYLLEYLPLTDTWIQNEIAEEDIGYWGLNDIKNGARVSLVLDGKWYIGFGDWYQSFEPGAYANTWPDINNRMYRFDPSDNTWTTISNVAAQPTTFCFSFTSNGKIYIAGSQVIDYNEFWEYDPLLDQ